VLSGAHFEAADCRTNMRPFFARLKRRKLRHAFAPAARVCWTRSALFERAALYAARRPGDADLSATRSIRRLLTNRHDSVHNRSPRE